VNGQTSTEFLKPKIVQAVGVAGIVAMFVFWAATGRLEPVLLSAFGGLVTFGGVLQARQDAKNPPPNEPGGGGT
jgi:hypothetical protein